MPFQTIIDGLVEKVANLESEVTVLKREVSHLKGEINSEQFTWSEEAKLLVKNAIPKFSCYSCCHSTDTNVTDVVWCKVKNIAVSVFENSKECKDYEKE